jgi:hypothetical protein
MNNNIALPTHQAIKATLLGCVFPQILRAHPHVQEVFDSLAHLLLHDNVAAAFMYHDRDVACFGDEVVLRGDALPGEIVQTK